MGYAYLHIALDDHFRLAYTEDLPDETAPTCAALLTRASDAERLGRLRLWFRFRVRLGSRRWLRVGVYGTRVRLTLSYALFLVVADAVTLGIIYVVMRYVPNYPLTAASV